jgi:hypothetical protein
MASDSRQTKEWRKEQRNCSGDMPWGVYDDGPRIGAPIPLLPDKRDEFATDLAGFAHHCFPEVYYKQDSEGQADDWDLMQTVTIKGGQFAFAAPRGDGKSTRSEACAIWAGCYGYHMVIVLIGAEQEAANEMIDSIKLTLRTNDRLAELFPEVCIPAQLADDTALRAKNMEYQGEDMHFRWGAKKLTFPCIPNCPSSGVTIIPRGMTGRIRGMRFKHPNGKTLRPSLMLIDDPQTDTSAASPMQCTMRERLITSAILGTAGSGKPPTALMPCTILKADDMASRILDREKHPEWHGRVRGMIQAWPKEWKKMNHGLWGEYFTVVKEAQRKEKGQKAQNDFYKANRAKMDKGAKVDHVLDPATGCLSSLQYAMDLYCNRGEEVFMAEYMNDPIESDASIYNLTPDLIKSRVREGQKVLHVPDWGKVIVAATDINQYGLHTAIIAFGNDQSAAVIWYGRFTHRGGVIAKKNTPDFMVKRAIGEALVQHGEQISRAIPMRAGSPMPVSTWVIDGGWHHETVQNFVKDKGRAMLQSVCVARGYPADRYRPNSRGLIGKPKEQCHAVEWPMGRGIAFNQHYWCEVAQKGWLGNVGTPGSCSLYDGKDHTEFAEHICREKLSEKFQGKEQPVWVYKTQPGKHDYGDAVYMCYVAAAWNGIGTGGYVAKKKKRRQLNIRSQAI